MRLDELWFRGLARLKLYRYLIVTEAHLADPRGDGPLPEWLTIRLLEPDDDLAYAASRPGHGRGECARRLAEGQWCVAAWCGGAIVSAVWGVARRAWIEYLDLAVDLAPDEVYIYDLYTVPELRGRGIAFKVTTRHLRYLQAEGYRRSLATLGRFNPAGASVQSRDRSRPIGWIGYVGLGPWRRPFWGVRPGKTGFAGVSRTWR